jgi:AraC-like DNA-binding protein
MESEEQAGMVQCLERADRDAPGTRRATDGWVRTEAPAEGIERIEASFRGQVYSPHRHDVYAIGITDTGVQCFAYRGEAHHSLPGRVIVLHPDEVHDGGAGNEDGFRYRMLYIDPALVSSALDGRPLPFVPDAVSADPGLRAAVGAALGDIGEGVDTLRRDEIVLSLADALAKAADRGTSDGADAGARTRGSVDRPAMARTRDYLARTTDKTVDSEDLEAVGGLDRWTLARQFRATYGTSPYRYFTMRRLDRVRSAIASGASLADAALDAGFADQAHMTRHFTRTYGLPPGRWAKLCGAA